MARVTLSSLVEPTMVRSGVSQALVLAGATVRPQLHGTSTDATIYSTETGATTITNPQTTTASGDVSGWVESGYTYDIVVTHPSGAPSKTIVAQAVAASIEDALPRILVKTGEYVRTLGALTVAFAVSNNRAYWAPIWLPAGAYDQIAVWSGATLGNAGSVGRLGLYQDDGTGTPGTRTADYGTVTLDAAGNTLKTITISLTVATPGRLVWGCCAIQGAATTTPTMLGYTATTTSPASGRGLFASTPTLWANFVGYHLDGVSGALPTPAAPSNGQGINIPVVGLRKA